tara:strand:+ start:48 stop:407 length:360 start_codon:yes stop_codon:yes gene_type:complete
MSSRNLIYTQNILNHGLLKELSDKINKIDDKFNKIDDKLNKIIEFLEKDVKKNCDKMGEHIDFVETVYDNVKNPLGYLCNKISYISGKDTNFTLTDIKDYNSDFDDEDDKENMDDKENL